MTFKYLIYVKFNFLLLPSLTDLLKSTQGYVIYFAVLPVNRIIKAVKIYSSTVIELLFELRIFFHCLFKYESTLILNPVSSSEFWVTYSVSNCEYLNFFEYKVTVLSASRSVVGLG